MNFQSLIVFLSAEKKKAGLFEQITKLIVNNYWRYVDCLGPSHYFILVQVKQPSKKVMACKKLLLIKLGFKKYLILLIMNCFH